MRKVLIVLFSLLVLVGCGNGLIHKDFKGDLNQVISKLDIAYEENRKLNEDEEKLVNKFLDKYKLGKFYTNGKTYEMNDIEKELTRQVYVLSIGTVHEETLSSEEEFYEMTKRRINELLKLKEVPEDLVGRYPTYEKQIGVKEEFLQDTKDVVNSLIHITGDNDEITQEQYSKLKDYVDLYKGEGFEVDGTYYMHNEESNHMYLTLFALLREVEEGHLTGYVQTRLIELHEKIN